MRRSVLFAVAIGACGPAPTALDPGGEFIAFPDDFKGYMSWESFHLTSAPMEGNVHTAGDRDIFLNRRPPADSTTFPVGTIIVKQLPASSQVFAMVKRGGDYNKDGALNWEWFELVGLDPIHILWQGIGPPSGEGYGSDAAACNTCHAGAVSNDYVQADALKLSHL